MKPATRFIFAGQTNAKWRRPADKKIATLFLGHRGPRCRVCLYWLYERRMGDTMSRSPTMPLDYYAFDQ